ncbi:MAG: hypothetical protein QM811_28745 [Pirellulales bacterium]
MIPRERQKHADRRIGHFFGAVIRYVADGNSSFASERTVDVVDPHAATDDQFALCQTLNRPAGQSQIVIEHDRRRRFDPPDEIGFGISVERDDIGRAFEQPALDRQIVGDKIRDHDQRAGHPAAP